jgi:DNA-binding NtrC family response regulator
VNHRLTPETLDAMMDYDWPGNVRELANAIERMVALNTGPWLHVADLPSALQNNRRPSRRWLRRWPRVRRPRGSLCCMRRRASRDCSWPRWKRRPS